MYPKFQITTGLLKAFEGPDNEKRFRTTASSTITDLAKDEITPGAIEQMANKANGNLTIFLNHEYRVPEDVLGSVENTSMQTRGVDSEGNPIVDLDFDIRLNQSNPRALQTWEAIKAGTKLGTSIGAVIRHAEKKKGGGLRIDDLELLEASIVGIPANPRSWVHHALRSITGITADGSSQSDASFQIDDETVIKDVVETLEAITAAAAPCKTCGHATGCDCTDCSCKKDAVPDKEASTTVSVTVETDSAQEAPKSSPETALADETADGDDAALGDSVTRDVEPDVEKTEEPDVAASYPMDASQLSDIVKQFQAAVSQIGDLQKKLAEVEAERDSDKANLVAAKAIIERIADLPIGRKTQFSGAVNDFRQKFGGTYDDEFIKFLEK